MDPAIQILGDSGYHGLQKTNPNALLPIRRKVDIDKLSPEQKAARK